MNTQQIKAGRQQDKMNKDEYYKKSVEPEPIAPASNTKKLWYSKLAEFIKTLFKLKKV